MRRFILLICIISGKIQLPAYSQQSDTSNVSSTPIPPQSKDFQEQSRDNAFQVLNLEDSIEDIDPQKRESWLSRKWKEVDKRINFNILKFKSVDGINLAAKYKWGVEQSPVDKGYYLRQDRWEAKARIDIGELFTIFENEEDANWILPPTPIKFGLEKKAIVTFYRQFEEHGQAMSALPYSPVDLPPVNPFDLPQLKSRLPLNADIAKQRLNPGDFVSMEARMNLFLGFGGAFLDGVFRYSANILYMMRGNFLVHFYKMQDQKIRMKIFAGEDEGIQGSGSVKFGFEFFKMDLANEAVEELTDFEIVEYIHESPKGKIMVLDYIFDLNSQDAVEAFNGFVSPNLILKDSEMIKQVFKDDDIQKSLLSDVEKINQIAIQDLNKPAGEKRIEKVFQALNEYDLDKDIFGINLLIYERKHTTNDLENFLEITREVDEKEYYFSTFYSKRKNISLDLGIAEWSGDFFRSFVTIFETDAEHEVFNFTDLGITKEESQVSFTNREQIRWIRKLKANLPEGEFEKIDWKNWGWDQVEGEHIRNCFLFEGIFRDCDRGLSNKGGSQLYYQFFINKNGLDILKSYSLNDFKRKLEVLKDATVFSGVSNSNKDEVISKWATRFFNIFSAYSDYDHEKKIKKLRDLRKKSKFRNYAPSFAKALFGEELKDSIFIYFRLFATDGGEVKFDFGLDSRELYNEIRSIDDAINSDDKNSYVLFLRNDENSQNTDQEED